MASRPPVMVTITMNTYGMAETLYKSMIDTTIMQSSYGLPKHIDAFVEGAVTLPVRLQY